MNDPSSLFEHVNGNLISVSLGQSLDFENRDIKNFSAWFFSKSDTGVFVYTDVRVGGFGPLFSGICLLTLIIIILITYYCHKNYITVNNYILFLCFLIFLTVIINPESWWARYVPQLWLIPLLILSVDWKTICN
jgi:hypothetical protein